jgi:hypothetical protein
VPLLEPEMMSSSDAAAGLELQESEWEELRRRRHTWHRGEGAKLMWIMGMPIKCWAGWVDTAVADATVQSPVHLAVSPRLSSFLIRFKFRFLRWFTSGEWIFSKYLYHLLA